MDTYLFSLLVQAAGTILLFVVFLLLYQKFRRPAFLDWIASWGFFLASIAMLAVTQAEAWRKIALPVLEVALLGHVFFLLRGVWRFRRQEAVSRPVELLWALPILGVAWWFSTLAIPEAPPAFLRAARVSHHGDGLRDDARARPAGARSCHRPSSCGLSSAWPWGSAYLKYADPAASRRITAMPTSSRCSSR